MRCGRAASTAMLVGLQILFALVLIGQAPAQGFLSTIPQDVYGLFTKRIQELRPGDFHVGVYWGGGQMRVAHNIGPGAASHDVFEPGITGSAFEGFKHTRETDLRDTFFTARWGLRCGSTEALRVNVETNLGKPAKFKQTTSAGTGAFYFGRPQPFGRSTLAVLYLPDDSEGVIKLDNRNRIFNADIAAAIPIYEGVVEFLVGWRINSIKSSLNPYSATTGIDVWQELPGITNWQNYWTEFGVTSNTGFSMSQSLVYKGPLIGLRVNCRTPASPRMQCYIEGSITPWVVGSYEFEWRGSYNNPLGFYINGSQTTSATGLQRFAVDVKGGAKADLTNMLLLEIWGKYSYLSMNGSTPELHAFDNNFAPLTSFSEHADQTVRMTVNFWGIGGDLVLPF